MNNLDQKYSGLLSGSYSAKRQELINQMINWYASHIEELEGPENLRKANTPPTDRTT